MNKIFQAVKVVILLGVLSCDNNDDEIINQQEEVVVITANLPQIRSARVKEDGYILVDGQLDNKSLSFSLFNEKLKRVDQTNHPSFTNIHRVYHPFLDMLAVMKMASNSSNVEMYFSSDNGRSFSKNFTFTSNDGDTWLGYLPVGQNTYLLHGATNWESSTILRVQDGVQISPKIKVLDGYSILDGFYDQGVIHVLANEVTNVQPSDSGNIHYFYSTDDGQFWEGHYYFGSLGKDGLKFQRIDDNTLTVQKPFVAFNFISEDNGKSWRKQSLHKGLTDVSYVNRYKGFGISKNIFYETIDGGATWKVKTTLTHTAENTFFLNETTGIIYTKDLIGYTQDGGLHWAYIVGE